MRYFSLHDYDCRYLFLSATSEGVNISVEQILGTHAWDWVYENEREDRERITREILEPDTDETTHGSVWINPVKEGDSRFYFSKNTWVGLPDVAYVSHIWEFPIELDQLSDREKSILWELGSGNGVNAVAKTAGITRNTVHAHLRNIRQVLGLDGIEQLTSFATLYRNVFPSGT